MRTKTRQLITREEYEYEEYRLSHEDYEVSENFYLFDQPMTDKELIKYLDDLILVNSNDDDDFLYTESDIPPDEFTFAKDDIHIDENGKKFISYDEGSQVVKGENNQVIELDDGQFHPTYLFKHYIK